MPAPKMVVKLWCLPRQTEDELKSLHKALIAALVKADIELSHIPASSAMRADTLKWRLAYSVTTVVKQRFPRAHVQGCFTWSEDFPSDI